MTKLKLKKILLKGFKSFSSDKGVQLTLTDINVLLGANGSGKSNFISFFRMLVAMMEGNLQNYIATAGTTELFLYYGVKKTKDIQISLLFTQGKSEYQYNSQLTYAIPDELIIKEEGTGRENDYKFYHNHKESSLPKARYYAYQEHIYNFLNTCKVFQFQDTSIESALRTSSNIYQTDYLQSNGGNIASYLYYLKVEHPEYYDRIVGYIRQIMPQFGDFHLQPNAAGYIMLKWKDNSSNDYIMLPQQISDGTLRFMALATLLLQPPSQLPSLVILDEPELGLHPAAVTQLAEMIKQASQHTQLILATQSPLLADEFEAHQIAIVERDEEAQCTTIHRLDEEQLKGWIEEYTISELWNKNVIGGRP